MVLSRRGVLIGLAVSVPTFGLRRALAAPDARYLSCADDRARHHFAVQFDATGGIDFALPLPARGHGLAARAEGAECIVVARRPGRYLAVIDPAARRIARMIAPPPGRSFYGHATFSPDGARLYASEHDDATGAGFIAVYDAAGDYRRLGDMAAGGIGPHELRFLPDGKTLVVAIGGIQTDGDREKLNLDHMDPSLVYLDAARGRVLEQIRPPAARHRLSIRHMDVAGDGTVALAMQYEGDAGTSVPMAALHRRGGELVYLRAPEDEERRLRHYLGSIAFDADARTVAATSPRGSVVALWDARSGAFLDMADAADGCGLATEGRGFLVTGGDGRLRRVDADAAAPLAATQWMWDNHCLRIA